MSCRAGYGTANTTRSPSTVRSVSPLVMCSTEAPPAVRIPAMAVPMLPAPKMVAFVMPFPFLVDAADIGISLYLQPLYDTIVVYTTFRNGRTMTKTRWLDAEQTQAWLRFAAVLELLPAALDAQ